MYEYLLKVWLVTTAQRSSDGVVSTSMRRKISVYGHNSAEKYIYLA
jgi:hypothetical protein